MTISTAHAEVFGKDRLGFNVGVGTIGASFSGQYEVHPRLSLRGSYNYLSFELEDQDIDGNSYDAELDFSQIGGFLDVHPFANGFTITGGYLFGERSLDITGQPDSDVLLGDTLFSPQEVGTLLGSGSLGDGGFYAGFGWDNITRSDGRINFVLRLGAIFGDNPNIELTSVGGTLSNDLLLRDALEAEISDINEQIESFSIFPVLEFGIGFKY